MRVFKTIAGLRSYLRVVGASAEIGLVPTMGALHAGHCSLIERAIAENEVAIATIFVNPLQFAPSEDLEQYPRTLEADCQLCEQLGVKAVFAPTPTEMVIRGGESDSTTTVLPPAAMMSVLCGPFRPGHFPGVATIVAKLLTIVRPARAYFGEKDAQQLAIIRRVAADLNLSVEICACPIVREKSGLAYSSRNQYLTSSEKQQATALYRSLQAAKREFCTGERQSHALISRAKTELAAVSEVRVEYVELVDPQTLLPLETIEEAGLLAIAAYLGSTRLIDNIILRDRQPIIAIDGPAGAGKSTVTRRVAEALELLYLDTGAMYRAIAWLVLHSGIAPDDEPAIAELASSAAIELQTTDPGLPTNVLVNGEDVTAAIRTPEVTSRVSVVAQLAAVRNALVAQQQRIGKRGGIVAEGRDIGTRVFPDAEVKIFLTASVRERARRRLRDLEAQGRTSIDLEQLEREIQERDRLDSHRKLSPLRQAVDAIEVITDGLSIEEVTAKILALYRQRAEK